MRILMFLVLIFMSGCSVLAPQEDKGAKEMARIIVDSCKYDDYLGGNTEGFADKVNSETLKDGVSVKINCGNL